MASVLLLYYHLLSDGGFSFDQTVYLDPDDFDGFTFIDCYVEEKSGTSLEIDETLIQEGAVIYLLCELKDQIDDYDRDFLSQPRTTKIVDVLSSYKSGVIPEVAALLEFVSAGEKNFDYPRYGSALQSIYEKYVRGFFAKKIG